MQCCSLKPLVTEREHLRCKPERNVEMEGKEMQGKKLLHELGLLSLWWDCPSADKLNVGREVHKTCTNE